MRTCSLKNVTGRELKKWWKWLVREQAGCCSVHFASTGKYRYCVCMGWHHYDDEPVVNEKGNQVYEGLVPKYKAIWKVAWKIGRQTLNNIMQCDLDVDFEMPFVTEAMAKADPELCAGDVDDTLEVVECDQVRRGCFGYRLGSPKGYRDWNALAAYVRKTARRVFKDWKDNDD